MKKWTDTTFSIWGKIRSLLLPSKLSGQHAFGSEAVYEVVIKRKAAKTAKITAKLYEAGSSLR